MFVCILTLTFVYLVIGRIIVKFLDKKFKFLVCGQNTMHEFELDMCSIFFPITIFWLVVVKVSDIVEI